MKKRNGLFIVIFLLAIAGIVNAQNIDLSKTKSNNKGAQIDPNMLQVIQISVGENTLKAGKGISFAGKEPVFTIKANEVTITAGEGIEVTGTYPSYTIEQKNIL